MQKTIQLPKELLDYFYIINIRDIVQKKELPKCLYPIWDKFCEEYRKIYGYPIDYKIIPIQHDEAWEYEMVEIPEKLKPYQNGMYKVWVKTYYKFNNIPIWLWIDFYKLRKAEKILNKKKEYLCWEKKFSNLMTWEEFQKMPKL